MIVRGLKKDKVILELSFDDAEFIGTELPRNDGFTDDWWKLVWQPMIQLHDD